MIESIDHDGVRELRLARPPVNALSPELVAALSAAVAAAPGEGAEAIVLAGRPGLFSAGLDLPVLLALDREGMRDAWSGFYGLLEVLATSPVPIATAVTGHSPAGGAVLALFTDFRVMSRGDFRIGLNEVAVGISMPPLVQAAARYLLGARQAARLTVGGLMLSPEGALAAGLVDALAASPEEAVAAALDWCRSLLALPRSAMLATRRLARAELVALFAAHEAAELDRLVESWFSDETQTTLGALVARLRGQREG